MMSKKVKNAKIEGKIAGYSTHPSQLGIKIDLIVRWDYEKVSQAIL